MSHSALRLVAATLLLALAGTSARAQSDPRTECEFTRSQNSLGAVECRIEVRGPEEDPPLRTQTTSLRLGNDFQLQVCSYWPTFVQWGRSGHGEVAFAQIRFSRPGSSDEHVVVLSHMEIRPGPYLAFDRFSVAKPVWSLENPGSQLPEVAPMLQFAETCTDGLSVSYHFRIEGDWLRAYREGELIFEQWVTGYAWQNWGDPEITEVLVDDFRVFQMPREAFVRTIWSRPFAE